MVAEQRLRQFHHLRSVHKTGHDETVCVTVSPFQNLCSRSVQRDSDPVTDRVMDRSVVQRVVLLSCGADDPGDPASAVPGVPGQGAGCRHDHRGATPGAGESEGAEDCWSNPGSNHRQVVDVPGPTS